MIKIDGVTKRYDSYTVLDNIHLNIKRGEFFVVIGPSGSGKTTFLKLINKMVEPDEGRIYIDGNDISKIKGTFLRRRIGYVIQSIGLLPHMTVKDNILIVPRLLRMDKKRCEERVLELLNLVELPPEHYLNKYPHQLSGGEAQRVGIARALAADPPIVLMDEPFGALDPLTKSRLQNQICRIHKELGETIVFVTHDIDEAIKIGQMIAIIRDGNIVQVDVPQNILSKPRDSFVASFLGSDRALKKLSKFLVKDYKRDARSVRLNDKDSISINGKYVWVIDDSGILKGWISYIDGVKGEYTKVDFKEFSVEDDETLKNALSKMIVQSVEVLPVCDTKGKLIGEISLLDIVTKA